MDDPRVSDVFLTGSGVVFVDTGEGAYPVTGLSVENVRYDEDLVCVTRTQSLSGGVWALRPVSLGARACALNPAGFQALVSDDF